MKSSNRSFAFKFRNFKSVKAEISLSLLYNFCSSFYSSELYLSSCKSLGCFQLDGLWYHTALMRILGVPKYFSNHVTYSALNVFTFENFINMQILSFILWLRKCTGPCFISNKHYFFNLSTWLSYLNALWLQKHNVVDVFNNDFQALISRICFVQISLNFSMFFKILNFFYQPMSSCLMKETYHSIIIIKKQNQIYIGETYACYAWNYCNECYVWLIPLM